MIEIVTAVNQLTWPGAFAIAAICFTAAFCFWVLVRS